MNALRRLYPYLKPHRKRLLLALAATTVFTLLSLIPPLLIRYLVNNVIKPQAWHLVPLIVISIGIVPIMAAAVRFINVIGIMLTSRGLISGMRKAMYEKVLNLSMKYHTTLSSGAIVGRIMDDVNMLQRVLTGETVRLVVDVIVFVFSLTIVVMISPMLCILLLIMLVSYVKVYWHYRRKIKYATEQYRSVYDQISGRLQETISGVKQVRIYNQEEFETNMFLDRTNRSLEQVVTGRKSTIGLRIACTAISGYGSTVICGVGAYMVIKGQMSYGDLHAVNSYIWMAINPLVRLTNMIAQLEETFVSIGRIMDVLEEKPDVSTNDDAPDIKRGPGRVEFSDMHFAYTPDMPLYQGLNLKVEAGQTVALVGPTGCGKTTLTQLVMRQWNIASGCISIDGTDISSVNLRSLRKLFGVVLQNPVIFEGTIAENIAYGMKNASREDIETAARAAELQDLYERLPEGLDAVLGTYGIKLSVGEKQRVSIARAILRDPEILIMDEATSSLDSESEALIQKALARVLKGRTSFIVAHRLSTITGADKIVVMRSGAIIEEGKHDELLEIEDGLYRRLYEELKNGSAEGHE
ncbi:MAG: ABC transporter ATP-binding protein [Planctomycetes bacterium]|nr:ABC transporter ATP-binding protein [Planctomycetota bacterium]